MPLSTVSSDDVPGVDVRASIPGDFRLASGERLSAIQVVGRLHGPEHGPLVVVAGGVSADRFATRWWPWAVRHGGPVDLNRLRVLAFDWLPGRDEGGLTLTTHDQARLLALLLDALGEPVIDAFVGASYGGCVGLAFAELFPERVSQLIAISAAHRAHPAATAWRGVQRRLLAFARDCGREAEGVSLARQLAMTTYRTAEEFDLRFDGPAPDSAGDAYSVCGYLIARGEAYDTSADRWITLSDSLDRHAVTPEAIRCPLTVVGFTSDRLVPIGDSRDLARRAPDLRRLIEAPSLFGHDAFLKERGQIALILTDALGSLPSSQAREIAA